MKKVGYISILLGVLSILVLLILPSSIDVKAQPQNIQQLLDQYHSVQLEVGDFYLDAPLIVGWGEVLKGAGSRLTTIHGSIIIEDGAGDVVLQDFGLIGGEYGQPLTKGAGIDAPAIERATISRLWIQGFEIALKIGGSVTNASYHNLVENNTFWDNKIAIWLTRGAPDLEPNNNWLVYNRTRGFRIPDSIGIWLEYGANTLIQAGWYSSHKIAVKIDPMADAMIISGYYGSNEIGIYPNMTHGYILMPHFDNNGRNIVTEIMGAKVIYISKDTDWD